VALLIGASVFATLLPAQEQDQPQPPTQAQPRSQGQGQTPAKDPAVERGEKLFEQNCGVCHGNDATGGRGPDLIRSPVTAHDVKGEQIAEVVHQGRPDKGMPAMPLSDPEVSEIAAFLHDRVKESISSSRVPKVYALERLLTGNADVGKVYFNGPGGCSNCHSPTGDLAGIAKKYSPIDLQARMLYPEPKLFKNTHTTVLVTLPSGEQIQGHLVHADDFLVGLIDSSGWYRSFQRENVKVELHDGLQAHRELLFKLTPADVHNLFAYVESLK
jgi:cytochrome c oxidase cbb3-type subunit III